MLRFGFARTDITIFEPGMALMGWGMRYNRAHGVAAPLHARALVVDSCDGSGGGSADGTTAQPFALVVTDTLLVTQGLWWGVVDRLTERHPELGLGAHNVAIAATHTHSGPSGYGHHFWINVNAPGFSPVVYEALVERIVEAIVAASGKRQPGRVRLADGVVPTSEGIAFNRSWFAYNRNPDVEPVTFETRDEATDRRMTVLRFDDADGRPVGMLNLFALHNTCVHADHVTLHPDHKGLAAMALEDEGLEVVFGQECAGDVSPNFRPDPRRGHTVGRFDDDHRNAEHVASVQARFARALFEDAGPAADGPVQVATRYVDFSDAVVDPRWTHDGRERRTGPARLGLAMANGTAEGPGPLWKHRWITNALNRAAAGRDRLRATVSRNYERRHDPKFPLIDLARGRDGRLVGFLPVSAVPRVDPLMKWLRSALERPDVGRGPWVPHIVPLQLVRLGPLVVAIAPFELSTVAGRRLRATLREALPADVRQIAVLTYANAYVGYMTTFEEYQVQHYEAGYTLFGPHSLGATRTAFAELAGHLGRASGPLGAPPPRVPLDQLDHIVFDEPWPDPLRRPPAD